MLRGATVKIYLVAGRSDLIGFPGDIKDDTVPLKDLCQERYWGVLVGIIAVLVYAVTLRDSLVLDDKQVILNNPVLRGDLLSLFTSMDTTGDAQLLPYYRPLTYLTFWIEGRLHDFNPFGLRLVNILLHAANACLVYRLAGTVLGNRQAALLAGLLFAVHPLHSEGVDFNSGGRNTMLSCLFILLTCLLHHRSMVRPSRASAPGAVACFLAGLFAKETTLAVFPLLLALEAPRFREKPATSRYPAAVRLLPYAAAAALYLWLRWLTLSRFGVQTGFLPGMGPTLANSVNMSADLGTRLLNNLYIIPRYLLTVISPTALATHYVVPDDLNPLALPLLLSWLGIIAALGWLLTRGRTPGTLFGLAWMILFWLPVSGIIYFPSAPLADRFIYIPAVGLWLVIADQTVRLAPAVQQARRAFAAVVVVLLVVLAGLTFRRNLDWENDITLYSRFVAQYPENIHAHAGLGSAYYNSRSENLLPLAIREFETVLSLNPAFPMIHTFLGNIKLDHNDLPGALSDYTAELGYLPNDKEARINRAIAYEKIGDYPSALKDFQIFLATPGTRDIPGSRAYAEEHARALSRWYGEGK